MEKAIPLPNNTSFWHEKKPQNFFLLRKPRRFRRFHIQQILVHLRGQEILTFAYFSRTRFQLNWIKKYNLETSKSDKLRA